MNRRLPNPLLDNRDQGPSPVAKYITRGLLIAAAVVSALLAGLMYLPGERLLVWYWVYIMVMSLPVILLLGALASKLYQSIRRRRVRLIVVWLMAFLVMTAGVIVYSLCSVYAQVGVNPVSYYTSPETGNRLVIMRALDLDDQNADTEKTPYFYGGYPMDGKLFYYPYRGDMVATYTGIDYVEWVDGGESAQIHITDLDGAEQVLNVSFDLSQPIVIPEE